MMTAESKSEESDEVSFIRMLSTRASPRSNRLRAIRKMLAQFTAVFEFLAAIVAFGNGDRHGLGLEIPFAFSPTIAMAPAVKPRTRRAATSEGATLWTRNSAGIGSTKGMRAAELRS